MEKKKIIKVYSRKADSYDFWSKVFDTRTFTIIAEAAGIRDGEYFVEAACGTGRNFINLSRHNPKGYNLGFDLTKEMLDKTREKARQDGIKNARLVVADARKIPCKDRQADLVVCNFLFSLLPKSDYQGVLKEFKRILKPNGRLVLTTMMLGNRWHNKLWHKVVQKYPDIVAGYSIESLVPELKKAGFKIVKTTIVPKLTFNHEITLARLK